MRRESQLVKEASLVVNTATPHRVNLPCGLQMCVIVVTGQAAYTQEASPYHYTYIENEWEKEGLIYRPISPYICSRIGSNPSTEHRWHLDWCTVRQYSQSLGTVITWEPWVSVRLIHRHQVVWSCVGFILLFPCFPKFWLCVIIRGVFEVMVGNRWTNRVDAWATFCNALTRQLHP